MNALISIPKNNTSKLEAVLDTFDVKYTSEKSKKDSIFYRINTECSTIGHIKKCYFDSLKDKN